MFAYQSDPTDPTTGTVDIGARLYQPQTGRFTQRDTVFGDATNPLTLNQYIYAADSPLVYTDPTGEYTDASSTGRGPVYDRRQNADTRARATQNIETYNNTQYHLLTTYRLADQASRAKMLNSQRRQPPQIAPPSPQRQGRRLHPLAKAGIGYVASTAAGKALSANERVRYRYDYYVSRRPSGWIALA